MEIKDYLSEEEMKEIAREEFKNFLKNTFEDERKLANLAYLMVSKYSNDLFDEKTTNILKEKILKIVNELSPYIVFYKDDFHKIESKAHKLVQDIVLEKKPLINKRIEDIINNIDFKEFNGNFKEEIQEGVYETIVNKLFKKEG